VVLVVFVLPTVRHLCVGSAVSLPLVLTLA
jgi:hypothetical protein